MAIFNCYVSSPEGMGQYLQYGTIMDYLNEGMDTRKSTDFRCEQQEIKVLIHSHIIFLKWGTPREKIAL